MKTPPFKLVEHPWPGAPKAIDDLYKRLEIVADIAGLEYAPIAEELLREAIEGFWDTILDAVTSPSQRRPRQKAEPKIEPEIKKGIWQGHGSQTATARSKAVLSVLHMSDKLDMGAAPSERGWMTSPDVHRALQIRSEISKRKVTYALKQLALCGKAQMRKRGNSASCRLEWRITTPFDSIEQDRQS